jgi:hypothetical protein
VRPQHSDADLLELATSGSAPAFASLLHRHRDVIQRGAIRAQHPEQAAEATLVAAVRELRRGRLVADGFRDRLVELVEATLTTDRGHPGVERLLPPDWFDRVWVRVEDRWPSGRRRLRPPRWVGWTAGAVVLAAAGSIGTYLVVTAEVTTEVVSELVAVPLDEADGMTPVPTPSPEAPRPSDSPELFEDVELGEVPTYDLTGGTPPGPVSPEGPTFASPEGERSGPAGG